MDMPASFNGQAILFDLDGTLRFNRPSSTQVFYDCAARLGAPDSPENRRQAIRWTHWYWAQSPDLLQDQLAHPQPDDFWLNYAERALLAIDCSSEQASELAPEIHRYMNEEHRPQAFVPPDIPATLEQLRASGYRLGVVTNRGLPIETELEALGLRDYFELSLTAGEVQAWKPSPEIFQHALQRLGASAAQTTYIGDNFYADILGAQNAGIQPILLDPEGVFPDADCPVITAISQVLGLLQIEGR